MEGDMDQDVIGTEAWGCDGCALTPRMRRDILLVAVEMYESWEAVGTSLRWDREVGGLVEVEPNPVLTMGDFLCELTGERHPHLRWDLLDYSDELFDWLKDFLHETWGDAIGGHDEDEEDDDLDPVWEAQCRVHEWLAALRVEDVLGWRSAQQRVESGAADWRSDGF
jgi:hypothetical protein